MDSVLLSEGAMSSFGIYIFGFVILIVGLAIAAQLLGVSSTWIGVGIIVLIGIGVLSGVSRTKRPDPPGTV
jgi:positive regulator of sigma E activity